MLLPWRWQTEPELSWDADIAKRLALWLKKCSCISSVCQFRAPDVSWCHLAVVSARWSITIDCTQFNWNSEGLVWLQRIAMLFAAALDFAWGEWGSLVSQPVALSALAGVSWEESATWTISDRRLPNQRFWCSLSLLPRFIKCCGWALCWIMGRLAMLLEEIKNPPSIRFS